MASSRSPRFYKLVAFVSIVAAVAAAGYAYRLHAQGRIIEGARSEDRPAAASLAPAAAVARSPSGLPDFSEIAARQGPAVVNVSVSGSVKSGFSAFPQLDPDDPFHEFFRRFQGPAPRSKVPAHGLGSGFIVSADGVLLTNAHVVDGADEVTVKLTDKREFRARVVGVDKVSDVAVLKIDAANLPTVRIGNPDGTRVGEWVVAIGSPFGFENSVTAGIVSAKSRTLPDEGYVPFLQTDVAINPGNSGGPLFNMAGEVIGINSQIYSRSGGYQGLSFAIPIDVAMRVERQLIDHGKVSRGRIGVMIQEVTQDLADSFGLEKPAGALVSSVEKGSPAEKAGIEPGDVILKFNGREIVRSGELPVLVSEQAPGSAAKLEVSRKGKTREISLNLGEMEAAAPGGKAEGPSGKGKLGLSVRPLTPEERKQAEVAGGLMVEDVGDGPAARAGIRPGDIILAVNGDRVLGVEQLRSLVDRSGGRLALQIQRDDNRIFVPIRIR